jgi:hypothetical protein
MVALHCGRRTLTHSCKSNRADEFCDARENQPEPDSSISQSSHVPPVA